MGLVIPPWDVSLRAGVPVGCYGAKNTHPPQAELLFSPQMASHLSGYRPLDLRVIISIRSAVSLLTS